MNKKGFTLIELLAVIVILGVILVIAIPSISAAILNSRKNAYVATANEFADGLRMMTLTDPTLLPSGTDSTCKSLSQIKLEKGSSTKSPFGKDYTNDSEICVAYNSTTSEYDYSVCLVDTGGNRICDINDDEYIAINIKEVTKESVIVGGGGSTPEPEPEPEPEPPYGNDANTLLLLHAEDFTDSSSLNNTISNTGVTISTDQKKFGNSSFYFNGSKYLNITNANLPASNSTVTVDMWIYPTTTNSGVLISIGNGSNSFPTGGVVWFTPTSAGYYANGNRFNQAGLNNPINTWHHIAFIYDGTVTKIYINGIALDSTFIFSHPDYMQWRTKTHIGSNSVFESGGGGEFFTGYIDEIRVSNTVRWTENFTPPIKAYY